MAISVNPHLSRLLQQYPFQMKDGTLYDKDFFLSPVFRSFVESLIIGLLDKNCKLNIVYDPDSSDTAYTDRQTIFLNAGNELAAVYKDLNKRALANIGLVAHECAHRLYLDFTSAHKAIKTLGKGRLYGGKRAVAGSLTQEEQSLLSDMLDALEDENQRSVFLYVYHQIDNIVADAHDEACLCRNFRGLVPAGIALVEESIRASAPTYEEMQSKGYKPLTILFQLVLEQARFDHFIALDPSKVTNDAVVQTLQKIKPFLELARVEDDYSTRSRYLNRCLLTLWPFIRETLKEESQQKQEPEQPQAQDSLGAGSQEQEQTQSQDTSGSDSQQQEQPQAQSTSASGSQEQEPSQSQDSSDSSSQQQEQPQAQNSLSAGSQEQEKTQSQDTSGSDSQQQEQPQAQNSLSAGSQEQEKTQSQDTSGSDSQQQEQPQAQSTSVSGSQEQGQSRSPFVPLQSAIQQVLEQLQAGSQGVTQAPQNQAGQQFQQKTDNSTSKMASLSEEKARSILQSIIQTVKNSETEKDKERTVEAQIKRDFWTQITTASQTSPHQGLPIDIVRSPSVSVQDIACYNQVMNRVRPFSKQMQRKVGQILEDLREGGIVHHRPIGRIIEANHAFRKDGQFFADKKLPQDFPSVAIAVLVDESGSMAGSRLDAAKETAILLDDFATGLGFPIAIIGHNSDIGTAIYPHALFERAGDKDRYRLAQMTARDRNRDGMALNIVVDMLTKRPEEIKFLIVISDGKPNSEGYQGPKAEEDIQNIARAAKAKGIQLFAAAIGDDKANIRRIYGESFLDVSDLSSLPKMMVRLISKRII